MRLRCRRDRACLSCPRPPVIERKQAKARLAGARARSTQRQHVDLEQQREPGTRPSPRRGDLAHPAVRTAHARHTERATACHAGRSPVPPRFILRVVNRVALASALGAGEPTPARKVHIQIEPTIPDRKLATRHRPRRLQPEGQLEKIGVSHPLTINSIPTDRSPTEPKNGLTHSIQRGAISIRNAISSAGSSTSRDARPHWRSGAPLWRRAAIAGGHIEQRIDKSELL